MELQYIQNIVSECPAVSQGTALVVAGGETWLSRNRERFLRTPQEELFSFFVHPTRSGGNHA